MFLLTFVELWLWNDLLFCFSASTGLIKFEFMLRRLYSEWLSTALLDFSVLLKSFF